MVDMGIDPMPSPLCYTHLVIHSPLLHMPHLKRSMVAMGSDPMPSKAVAMSTSRWCMVAAALRMRSISSPAGGHVY